MMLEDDLMPLLFIGHGNPMNGIEANDTTRGWQKAVENVPRPKAIVVVSAHWETVGTLVTAMPEPRLIYDFYGFPAELFAVKYEALGHPELALEISDTLSIGLDLDWGLDHGSWTVLRHLYPEADIPVLQISLDRHKTPAEHFEFAKGLNFLRKKGVLIIGSGNLVHNLRLLNFRQKGGFEWAETANERVKTAILAGDFESLINFKTLGDEVSLGIPTLEHYLPLLYVLALKKECEKIKIFNDSVELGSIAMTSIKVK